MKYSKQFIILKQDRLGYSFKGKDPSGRAIIEISSGEVKLRISVQDLRPENLYKAYLIKSGDDKSVGVFAGSICPDSLGKYEMRAVTSFDNIFDSGVSINEIDVIAVMSNGSDEVVAPLSGYKNDIVRWKNNFTIYAPAEKKDKELTEDIKEIKTLSVETIVETAEAEIEAAEVELAETEVLEEALVENCEAEPCKDEHQLLAEDNSEIKSLSAETIVETAEAEIESVEVQSTESEAFAEAIIEISETAEKEAGTQLGCFEDDNDLPIDEPADIPPVNGAELFSAFQSYDMGEDVCSPHEDQENSEELFAQALPGNFLEDDSESFSEKIEASLELSFQKPPSEQESEEEFECSISQPETEEIIQTKIAEEKEAEVEMVSLSTPIDEVEDHIGKSSEYCEETISGIEDVEYISEQGELNQSSLEEYSGIASLFGCEAEYIKPFERQNKDVDWIEIGRKELLLLDTEFGKILGNSFILACLNRYGHLIIGRVCECGREEYYLGTPDIYNHEYRTTAYRLGFSQFKTAKDVPVKNGEFGYWLMAITIIK